MNVNQIDTQSLQNPEGKMAEMPSGEQVLNSEESTSSESTQNRQDKLCQQLDELCQFFEVKSTDKTKQKDVAIARQIEVTDNLVNQIVKSLEYENFNSKFFGNG